MAEWAERLHVKIGKFKPAAVLRIRDVYRIRVPIFPSWIQGQKDTGYRIPDPYPHQRFEVVKPKKLFLSYRKYDPGCSSRIQYMIRE
jgi:hypothetical protein